MIQAALEQFAVAPNQRLASELDRELGDVWL
jgi:hypothetical protein